MFNSTHTLVGLAIARTGLSKWVPRAAWVAVIASNLPDIDIVTQFAGTTSYLDHHRGITHALVAVPFLAFALAAVMAVGLGSLLWRYFFIALLAMLTHPLLDWANTYGVRPFLPLTGRWYYGDTLFIIDPWLDLILLIGVLLSYRSLRSRWVSAATLVFALLYIASMAELHAIAATHFDRMMATVPGVVRSAVGPEFLNPLDWTGYVSTGSDVSSYRISLLTGDVREESRMPNEPESKVTAAAEATHTAEVFRSFARFPVTRVKSEGSSYRVQLIDFRFYRPTGETALLADITLNQDLQVTDESMSFVGLVVH